jgi:predicted ferric reductase
VVRARPDVLRQLVRSEARWIAPSEDLLDRIEAPPRGRLARAVRLLQNHAAPVLMLGLWGVANVALFTAAVLRYQHLGAHPLVQLARGCGACLNLNGALILVPMMRRLLTWVRKVWLGRLIPVDDAIAAHRLVGNAMFGFGVVHTLAHLCNYAFVSPKGFLDQLFVTRAGLTGVILLAVFSVMWFFARQAIRRARRFELFYRTHLLYLAWLALLLGHGPVYWKWAAVPLAGFVLEQILRLHRRAITTRVASAQALRSGVTRIELDRPPGFTHRAGDYLFVRIPAVARHEWHPFTISSAPGSPALTLHVRSLGNWTTAMRVIAELKHATGYPEPLVAHIDGPYGTASSEILASRFAVLIGAGIGVTPFASVLESVMLSAGDGGGRASLRKLHFFWLNRDQYSFEWFAALLAQLEASDRRGLLDIHICMTGGRPHLTAAALHLAREVRHEEGGADIVTGLRTKTAMGSPEWELWLGDIARQHAPEPVDLYFCGPPGLGAAIRPICKRLGMRFRQEHF